MTKIICNSCQKEIVEGDEFKYSDDKFYCVNCTFYCRSCCDAYPDYENSGWDVGGDKICKYCATELFSDDDIGE